MVIGLSFSQNPIHHCYMLDTSIYQYVSKMLVMGYTPYLDVWDHKGPIVYFWYALGNKMHPLYGMYTIEVIWLFFAFILIYIMIRRYESKIYALCSIIILFLTIPITDTIGNTESLALFPLVYIIYIGYQYLYTKQITRINIFLAGLISSVLLLIKPIYLIVPMVFFTYILMTLIKDKKGDTIKKLIFIGLMGFITFLLPILLWLYNRNALSAFYDSYIAFNLMYAKQHQISTVTETLLFFLKEPSIVIALISMIVIYLNYNKYNSIEKKWLNLITTAFACTFIVLIIPKNTYAHYLFILYPFIIFLLIFMLQVLKSETLKAVIIEISIISFLFVFYNNLTNLHRKFEQHTEVYQELANVVKKELKKDEKFVSLLNDYSSIYLYASRLSDSRFPSINVVEKIWPQQVKDEFQRISPKILISTKETQISITSEKSFKFEIKPTIKYAYLFELDDYEIIYEKKGIVIYKLKKKMRSKEKTNE